ncbi:MAG: cyclic nucleotide-binding domain-containing protein [Pseudomonadota bacterium]
MSVDSKTLARLYPMDTLADAHLAMLAQHGEVRDYTRDETLFREGDNDGESLFLLSGSVSCRYPDGRERELHADSDRTRYAIGDFQPRRFTAIVSGVGARAVVFDRNFLEKVVTWDQISRSSQFTLPDGTAESARWVFKMLNSQALLRLPAGNIERMFERFELITVMPDRLVIKEGDDGDFFYVIKSGDFQVIKQIEGREQVVATLSEGDSFGEDALTSNEPRNASVKARTAGQLMRLGKSDFSELLKHPVVDWVSAGQASALLTGGAALLDVRMKEEHQQRHLAGSVNAPLFRLREEMAGSNTERPFVVYCETGERSASAAFILNKLGFRVFALRGGLSSVSRQLIMRQQQSA